MQVNLEDDLPDIFDHRPILLLALPHLGVEARPADGHIDVLGHRDRQLQIGLRQGGIFGAFHVQHADDLPAVMERHANLRVDAADGAQEVRVGADIGQEDGLTGAHGPRHHPAVSGISEMTWL